MSRKRIKIRSGNKEAVCKALEKYCGDSLYLDLEDCKEVYKILSTCPDVEDWDFCDIEDNSSTPNPALSSSDLGLEIENFYDLSLYIEAIWRATKEDNNFGSADWKRKVGEWYAELRVSENNIERLGLKTILEGYYSKDLPGCIKEMYSRLEGIKQNLPSIPTLTFLTAALLKNKPIQS